MNGGPVELQETLRNLCSIQDPSGTVVTMALDLAKAKPPHSESGRHYGNRLHDLLGAGEQPMSTREILRGISRKVYLYLQTDLRPETEGVFLVVGPGIWEPFQLNIPIKDFIHVGRTPYLAPLLEALFQMPRAYVLRFDQVEGILEDVSMGARREIAHLLSDAVERDAQHQMTGHSTRSQAGSGRSETRTGGGGRDRYDQCVEDAVEAMLHKAANKVVALQPSAPSESIYAFGDRKHYPYFRDHLPVTIRPQAILVGPIPHRHDDLLGKSVRVQQESRVRHRIIEEIQEFRTRRAEQCHVATGPAAILPLLETGKVARVFLDAGDPLPGKKCPSCGGRAGIDRATCEACGTSLVMTSMTQEVISHALLHPPLPLTFVPPGESWLEESMGMGALLSEKGSHPRK